MNNQDRVRDYWDNTGASYSEAWRPAGKARILDDESRTIKKLAKDIKLGNVLDIGVGTGRILRYLLDTTTAESRLYGIDISQEMANICRQKYAGEPRIVEIITCDIACDPMPFDGIMFSLITMVRVLPYNASWKSILSVVCNRLEPNGVLFFTIVNKRSISRLAFNSPGKQRSTYADLRRLLERENMEIVEMKGNSILPDSLHNTKIEWIAKVLDFLEEAATKVFGPRFLKRQIYISARRKT